MSFKINDNNTAEQSDSKPDGVFNIFEDFGNDFIPGLKSHLKDKQPRRKNTIMRKYKKRKKR